MGEIRGRDEREDSMTNPSPKQIQQVISLLESEVQKRTRSDSYYAVLHEIPRKRMIAERELFRLAVFLTQDGEKYRQLFWEDHRIGLRRIWEQLPCKKHEQVACATCRYGVEESHERA
jgi:hypothetical protein